MRIKFVQSVELEVFQPFDGTSIYKIFNSGTVADVEFVTTNVDFDTAMIQFNDGSVVYGVPMMVFESI